jgi:hypothetical protein
MKHSLKIFALVLFFSSILQLGPALSAGGGVAPGFDATHWIARLHIFLISFVLMTGGSIAYYFLLRRKKAQ